MRASPRIVLAGLAWAMAPFVLPHMASAATSGREYMAALQNGEGVNELGGISVAKVFKDGSDPATALDMRVSQVNAMLRGCRMGGGGSGGYPGIKSWSVDYRFFECPKDGAPATALLVILPFDREGKLTAVYVKTNGPFQDVSPAPTAAPNEAF